jgi:hypothetical protein
MEALFLDQNKWIELACVRTGTVSSGPSYIAYAELHEAVERGRVVAPLTVAHILETSKRNDQASRAHTLPRCRPALAKVSFSEVAKPGF